MTKNCYREFLFLISFMRSRSPSWEILLFEFEHKLTHIFVVWVWILKQQKLWSGIEEFEIEESEIKESEIEESKMEDF